MKVKLKDTTIRIVNHLQLSINHIKQFIGHEQWIMKKIANKLALDAIGQQVTTFLIGLNYHSHCHIDVDMFYTPATAIAPKDICVDNMIYYFLFQNFEIKILLRSGGSFLFNPIVSHSCYNLRYIMSAYVSCKTLLRSHPL